MILKKNWQKNIGKRMAEFNLKGAYNELMLGIRKIVADLLEMIRKNPPYVEE